MCADRTAGARNRGEQGAGGADRREGCRSCRVATVPALRHGGYRQAWPGREWSAAVSLPVAAWLRSHLQRADEYAACTNAQARGLASLCRGTRRAAVTRLGSCASGHRPPDRLAVATPASNSLGQRPGADAFGHRRGRRDVLSAVFQRASWLEARQSAGQPAARYRGSGATKRGLSSEQVPVVTALERAGGVVEAVLDGRREDDIVIALCGSIAPGSLICSDGLSAYPKLAERVASEHRTIEPFKPTPEQKAAGLSWRRPGTLTLGRVNGHHAVLKNAINGLFKGVSTRYLPGYLAWLRTLRNKPEPVAFLAA